MLLRVENLVVEYRAAGHTVHAVSDVSFDVARGETLGLVGESGCGKSTLGRAILQLPRQTAGRVVFEGIDLGEQHAEAMRKLRRRLQIIFQDPIASLNPRRTVGDIVAEPLIIAGVKDAAERNAKVREALQAVGLDPELVAQRRPHEFSGGQCQRISIARTLVLEPHLVICDEPVSALDVSIRAQIINLLEEMKARYGLTLIFIAHDLAVVKVVSDRVAVMYLGKLCEIASTEQLFRGRRIPTRACCSRRSRNPIRTRRLPTRCRSASRLRRSHRRAAAVSARAARARPIVAQQEEPVMRQVGEGQFVACHYPYVALD
jgi:peptide/nickel transport system ATP-binding protein